MSDYLTNLLLRARSPERTIQPRLSSMYDPVSPGSVGGEVGGWGPEESLHPPGEVNEWLPRHDLLASRSFGTREQDRTDGETPLESATQSWEQASVSTDGDEPLNFSSETASTLEPRAIERDADSVTAPTALSRLDDEQRWATSRPSAEDKPVSFSPIGSSVAAGSSPVASIGPDQEETVVRHRAAGQSASPARRSPSDQANEWGRGPAPPPIDDLSDEKRPIPQTVTTTGTHGPASKSYEVGRGPYGSVSSPVAPFVGAPTGQSDGQSQARLSATVPESEGTIPALRKAVSGEPPNISEFSLDPSLVSSAPATKIGRETQQVMSGKLGDTPGIPSPPADQQQLLAHSLAVPLGSKKFIAERRIASPMTATIVNHASATDSGKPVEPVVQVTIGRVEVRAVAPPVRQEKGRKSQSAMSLDDYLKRRGGRSGG